MTHASLNGATLAWGQARRQADRLLGTKPCWRPRFLLQMAAAYCSQYRPPSRIAISDFLQHGGPCPAPLNTLCPSVGARAVHRPCVPLSIRSHSGRSSPPYFRMPTSGVQLPRAGMGDANTKEADSQWSAHQRGVDR